MKPLISILTMLFLLMATSLGEAQLQGDDNVSVDADGTESAEANTAATEGSSAEDHETQASTALESEEQPGQPVGEDSEDHPEWWQDDPHTHHIGLFLGIVSSKLDTSDPHGAFGLGLDYEFRLPFVEQLFGVGLVFELGFGEHTEVLLGIPLIVHPIAGLAAYIAPGFATAAEKDYAGGSIGVTTEPMIHIDPYFLFRIGARYIFQIAALPFGKLSLAPEFNIDIVGSHLALVYGVSVGLGF